MEIVCARSVSGPTICSQGTRPGTSPIDEARVRGSTKKDSPATRERDDHRPGREDSAAEAVAAGTGPGTRQRVEGVPDRGLQPAAVLRDPAKLPGVRGRGAAGPHAGARGPHPNRVASEVEEAILAHALAHPTHGAQRVAGTASGTSSTRRRRYSSGSNAESFMRHCQQIGVPGIVPSHADGSS